MTDYERNREWFHNMSVFFSISLIVIIIGTILSIVGLLSYYSLYNFLYGPVEAIPFLISATIFAYYRRKKKGLACGIISSVLIGYSAISTIANDILFLIQGHLNIENLESLVASGLIMASFIISCVGTVGLAFFREIEPVKIEYFIDNRDKKSYRKISLLYLIFIIFFVIAAFSPSGDSNNYLGYYYLIYGGFEGLFFIILSIIFAFKTKVRKTYYSGAIGCLLATTNLVSNTIVGLLFGLSITPYLFSVIGFCIVTISLYQYGKNLVKIEKISVVPSTSVLSTPQVQPAFQSEPKISFKNKFMGQIQGFSEKIKPTTKEESQPSKGELSQDERLDKLKKIVRVSKRLEVSRMADVLKMPEKELWDFIFDWAEDFGFLIDKDVVEFNADRVDDFIAQLDNEFKKWETSADKI